MPASGFRAVEGGASTNGKWVIAVLDSSSEQNLDQLPESHWVPYLLDLDTMKAVSVIGEIETLGGYHGRPEKNVRAKWLPSGDAVCITWRIGRMNQDSSLFSVSDKGALSRVKLPNPLAKSDNLFEQLKPNSNSGRYFDGVTDKGDLRFIYYGFWPKKESFYQTPEGKVFDHNRIEVLFSSKEGQWKITSVSSKREV